MNLQSWIHWSRGRRPFYNKIGEVGGRWKIVGGKSEKHGRLISTQYFYFSDKNDLQKLSAAPTLPGNHRLSASPDPILTVSSLIGPSVCRAHHFLCGNLTGAPHVTAQGQILPTSSFYCCKYPHKDSSAVKTSCSDYDKTKHSRSTYWTHPARLPRSSATAAPVLMPGPIICL